MNLLAALVQEKDPPQWSQLPDLLRAWLQSAGGVAAIALVLFTVAALLRSRQSTDKRSDAGPTLLGLALLFPPVALILWLLITAKKRWLPSEVAVQLPFLYVGTALTLFFYMMFGLLRALAPESTLTERFFVLGGLTAVTMVLAPPVVAALTRMRWARIWALSRLSMKEAVRSRVVLVFAIMALVFLFADWFVPYKAEDQVRNYVRVVYWSMSPLFLLTATLMGAFSLPTDIKNQSIHTIVTKPVDRFEIVLGRFLGYGVLLTVGLAAVSALSYVYIWRNVTPEAKSAGESFKARQPIYGNLYFYGTKKANEKSIAGESVGREWGYRSYISGPHISNLNTPPQYAVWEFDELPSAVGQNADVPFEFTLDIFRLQKGEENKGVFCTFTFMDGRRSIADLQTLRDTVRAERNKRGDQLVAANKFNAQERAKLEEALLAEYGFYENGGFPVADYHTQSIKVPSGLFKKVHELEGQFPREGEPGKRPPQLVVAINVDHTSHSQLIGAARRDLYLLAAEQPFWQNFFKGIVGMWFTYLLVLGVAIACSTYLSGVISWLTTLFLFGAGLFNEYIQDLALNRAVGGGPFESLRKMATRTPITVPLDPTPASSLVLGFDEVYRWWLRMFMHIIPDVNRFDLHHYVANGFDIAWSQILFLDNFVYLAGYLLPWAVLAYYLLRFREIANPT